MRFFAPDDKALFDKFNLQQKVRAAQILGRPISKSEESAMDEKLKIEYCIWNMGVIFASTAGIGLGVWRARDTQQIWRFPFRTPRKDFNPNVIRIRPTSRMIIGEKARNIWYNSRLASYLVGSGMTGWALGTMASKPIAALMGAVIIKHDPRLRELHEALQKYQCRRVGSRRDLPNLEAYSLRFLERIRKLDLQPLWWPIYIFFLRTD